MRLRRRLRGHTRSKLSNDDIALCRSLTDSYLRHDPDAEAAVHGEASPDTPGGGEVALDENLDATNGVDLAQLPDPFPEPLGQLHAVMGRHRAACEVLARRDEELADASILREMARILRSHAEYAAELATVAREEIEDGHGDGHVLAAKTIPQIKPDYHRRCHFCSLISE